MSDLFTYPHAPGSKRAGTSEQAAPSRKKMKEGHRMVTFALSVYGELTADEIATVTGRSILYIRPRVSELRALHLIEPTGETRANASGKQADVMRLK